MSLLYREELLSGRKEMLQWRRVHALIIRPADKKHNMQILMQNICTVVTLGTDYCALRPATLLRGTYRDSSSSAVN